MTHPSDSHPPTPLQPTRLWRLRDAWLLAPAYAIPGAASFLTIPLLFAALGPAEYGRWALLYGIAAGVPQVTTSWLEATVVRFGHRDRSRARTWGAAVACAGSVAFSIASVMIVIPRPTPGDVASAVVLTTLVSLYVLAIARLQSALAFGAISLAAALRSTTGAVAAVVAGWVSGEAAVAILGLAGGYALGQAAAWLAGRRAARSGGSVPIRPDDGPPEHLSYGLASGVAAVSNYALSVGDRFILSAMRPLSVVGSYAATYALVDLAARFLPAVVLTTMRPRVFRAWDSGMRAELGATVLRLAAVLAWVVAAAASGLVVAASLVPGLPIDLGLVAPIAAGFACFVAANGLGLAYSSTTKQGRLAAHALAAATANIAINLALIPSLGALGAAVATAVSYALLLVLNGMFLPVPAAPDGLTILVVAATATSLAALWIGHATTEMGLGLLLSAGVVAGSTPLVVRLGGLLRRPD